jgi:sortase A
MRALEFAGKFLISAGVGVLLFVAWGLWGTGFYTARQQARLEASFEALPDLAPPPGGPTGTGPPEEFSPVPGEPVFRLRIPEIGLDSIVVEGVESDQLRMGPGHFPACREGFEPPFCLEVGEAWPGGPGRVIVSGHRTTYGMPFWDLDELEAGDDIRVESRWGEFTYEVSELQVAEPDQLALWVGEDVAEMVLVTCNPPFSVEERLFVFAELQDQS